MQIQAKQPATKGVANFVVIIFVIIASAGLITYYILAGEVLSTREKIKAKETETNQIKKETDSLQEILAKISPYVTDITFGSIIDDDKIESTRKFLEDKSKSYAITSKVERKEEIGGEDMTIEFIVSVLGGRLTASELGETLSQYGKKSAETRRPEFEKVTEKINQLKDEEISEVERKRNELAQEQSKIENRYATRQADLNNKKSQIEQAITDKTKDINNALSELEYKIERIETQIEDLACRQVINNRDIVEVQGKIIKPAVRDWYAFINLGERDNIKLGLKFRVFRRDSNGTRKWKGQVEVKKVFDTYSQVSVTAVTNQLDPIVEGDYITNIFFNHGKPKYVLLLGKMLSPDFKYNKPEIKRRLTEIGVVVENDVSLRTDFVILGGKEQDMDAEDQNRLNEAKLLNIPYLEGIEAREFIAYCLGD